MHMADALLAPAVAGTMYLCSGAATGYSIKKVRALNEPEKIPTMGVMGAFVFAAQMINFTIPGTGSSGHDRGSSDTMSSFCGRRNSGFGGECLEYGVLRLLFRRHGYLEPDNEKGYVQEKNNGGFCYRVHIDLAAWGAIRQLGDSCVRSHGTALWDICGGYAAYPSCHRSGRRTDYGSSFDIYL